MSKIYQARISRRESIKRLSAMTAVVMVGGVPVACDTVEPEAPQRAERVRLVTAGRGVEPEEVRIAHDIEDDGVLVLLFVDRFRVAPFQSNSPLQSRRRHAPKPVVRDVRRFRISLPNPRGKERRRRVQLPGGEKKAARERSARKTVRVEWKTDGDLCDEMWEFRGGWISIRRRDDLGTKYRENESAVQRALQESGEDDVYERRVEFNHVFGRYGGERVERRRGVEFE